MAFPIYFFFILSTCDDRRLLVLLLILYCGLHLNFCAQDVDEAVTTHYSSHIVENMIIVHFRRILKMLQFHVVLITILKKYRLIYVLIFIKLIKSFTFMDYSIFLYLSSLSFRSLSLQQGIRASIPKSLTLKVRLWVNCCGFASKAVACV